MSTIHVTHACPPDGSGFMPCCDRTPFEALGIDRMTTDPAAVTCNLEGARPDPDGPATPHVGHSDGEQSVSEAPATIPLDDAPDDRNEPCGESMCRCDGWGPDHYECACGCDCPRDEDGQKVREG